MRLGESGGRSQVSDERNRTVKQLPSLSSSQHCIHDFNKSLDGEKSILCTIIRDAMNDLFTPVSTTYKNTKNDGPSPQELKSVGKVDGFPVSRRVSSLDEALANLKGQPDYKTLVSTLKFLNGRNDAPSPQTAAIAHSLITEIIPNYWLLLSEESQDEETEHDIDFQPKLVLIRSLQTLTGLNALLAHLKSLLQEFNHSNSGPARTDVLLHLESLLAVLAASLQGGYSIRKIWQASIGQLSDQSLRRMQSQSLATLIAGGKVFSLTSEAIGAIGKDSLKAQLGWLTLGDEYSKWIGENLCSWMTTNATDVEYQFGFDLLHRAMSLGYSGKLQVT